MIWKFPLGVTDVQVLEVPFGAKFLTVQVQNGVPCLWALVNPESGKVGRTIEVFGTGHHMDESDREYIGTFQLSGGALVFHVFERLG